jgi:hypothetical protein
MDWEGEDRRTPDRWKIKKEVSLPDIISFLTAVIAVVFAYTTLDKRTYALEQAAMAQESRDSRQDEESIRVQARIEAQIGNMNQKLDRLIERGR